MTGMKRNRKPLPTTTGIDVADIMKYTMFTYEPLFLTGLLGQYMSKKTGVPFEDLLEQKIILPLGLNNTYSKFSDHLISKIFIGGQSGVAGEPFDLDLAFDSTAANIWNLGLFNPTGGISTASDLSKVMRSLSPSNSHGRACNNAKALLDPFDRRPPSHSFIFLQYPYSFAMGHFTTFFTLKIISFPLLERLSKVYSGEFVGSEFSERKFEFIATVSVSQLKSSDPENQAEHLNVAFTRNKGFADGAGYDVCQLITITESIGRVQAQEIDFSSLAEAFLYSRGQYRKNSS
eukprot:Nk52_evm6s1607 gene=Nk52_evmTU6s1607